MIGILTVIACPRAQCDAAIAALEPKFGGARR